MSRPRGVRALVMACAIALAVAVPAARGAVLGGHGQIGPSGHVGPLRIDRSTEARVRAFAGAPKVEQSAGTFGVPFYPRFSVLGYNCGRGSTDAVRPVGAFYCRTVFYINHRTRRLAAFYTSSSAYSGPDGIRSGMPAADAERRTRHAAYGGCLSGLSFGDPVHRRTAAWLFIDVLGGRSVNRHGTQLVIMGGTLGGFSLESTHHPVGLLFC
jgi:hypothetical protein